MRRAHTLDVGEHPGLNTELDGTANDSGDNLRPEHDARGNLHVVTELEIGGEFEILSLCECPSCYGVFNRDRHE